MEGTVKSTVEGDSGSAEPDYAKSSIMPGIEVANENKMERQSQMKPEARVELPRVAYVATAE